MPEGLIIRTAGFTSMAGCFTSRSMIVLQTLTHESQMYTPGPAMIFFTSACDFPQKEQSVILDDLAMARKSGFGRDAVEVGIYAVRTGASGGGLHHKRLGFPGRGHDMVH